MRKEKSQTRDEMYKAKFKKNYKFIFIILKPSISKVLYLKNHTVETDSIHINEVKEHLCSTEKDT